MSYSWEFTKRFNAHKLDQVRSWAALDRLKGEAQKAFEPCSIRLSKLKMKWEGKLGRDFDNGRDLSTFRPLRLTREEDWSDWLAWLLETSKSGILATELFGTKLGSNSPNVKPFVVEREKGTGDRSRRGDILLKWKDSGISLEVKLYDRSFEKSYDTARKFEMDYPNLSWNHFILLSNDIISDWEQSKKDDTIIAVLWKDVSKGIRQSLWNASECLIWNVWAWTFCQAIEQKILRLRIPTKEASNVSEFQMELAWTEILSVCE